MKTKRQSNCEAAGVSHMVVITQAKKKKTIEENVALSERPVRIEKMELVEEENVQNAVRLHLCTNCPSAALSHQSLCYEKHLFSVVPDKAAKGVKVAAVFMETSG